MEQAAGRRRRGPRRPPAAQPSAAAQLHRPPPATALSRPALLACTPAALLLPQPSPASQTKLTGHEAEGQDKGRKLGQPEGDAAGRRRRTRRSRSQRQDWQQAAHRPRMSCCGPRPSHPCRPSLPHGAARLHGSRHQQPARSGAPVEVEPAGAQRAQRAPHQVDAAQRLRRGGTAGQRAAWRCGAVAAAGPAPAGLPAPGTGRRRPCAPPG